MKNIIDDYSEIQVILKLPGQKCNLQCQYCYEKQRNYTNQQFLTDTLLKKFLNIFDGRLLSIQLHGGEPLLLGIENIRSLLSVIKEYKGSVKVNIQTNGVLLNDEWLDMFEQEFPGLEIGISLDGDEFSNSFRLDYNNKESISSVEKAIRTCEKRNRNIGIISVVNQRMLGREHEVLEYFKQFKCIKIINFTPCFDYKILNQSQPTESAISALDYNEFMKGIFWEWRNNEYYRNYVIDPIYSIIRRLYGKDTTLCHYNQYKCAYMLTLYPDGMIGACDETSEDFGCYGNVDEIDSMQVLLQKQKEFKLFHEAKQLNLKCEKCNYNFLCHEGCIATKRNFALSGKEYEYCYQRADLIDFVKEQINL